MLATLRTVVSKCALRLGLSAMIAMLLLAASQPVAHALTSTDRFNYMNKGIYFIDEYCGVGQTDSAITPIGSTANQDENAKTVIGIAKTLNLGEKGALIGLMVGLAESTLSNLANEGKFVNPKTGATPYINTQLGPISTALPNEGVGNDNDSVGIMQQRAIDGNWGPVNPDTNLAENIKWLMTPAYAAEAFFAMPQGKRDPKALVRVANWETMDPALAAQAVQRSGVPNGNNYRSRQAAAQSLMDRLYAGAAAIPLPVPLASEGGPVNPADPNLTPVGCPSIGSGGSKAILAKIQEYAWPNYRPSGLPGATEKKGDQPGTANDTAYAAAVNRAPYKGDGCHGGGVDCGAFVTIVMRESGADPKYNSDPMGNTSAQLAYLRRNSGSGGKYTKVTSKDLLKAGDIAIRSDGDPFPSLGGHTFFFVGTEIPNWGGQAASASQCDRAPMASGTDTFSEYEWYHLN